MLEAHDMYDALQKTNILIVDDTPANLLTLHSVLADESYNIVEADCGEAALEVLFKEQDFALILMDVQMPGMNGFETVELIKSRSQCAEIPVIFLTAINSEDKHEVKAYKTGAIDFFSKPYDPDILQAKVAGFVELYCIKKQMRDEIRKRKAIEQQLRLASQVFEHAGEGIMITDKHSVIEAVNPAFVEITGYSVEEAIGQSPSLLSSGRQPPEFYQKLWETLKEAGVWEGEIYNRRKNGEVYAEWLKIVVVRDDAGEIIQYIGSFSDITAHTSARQRLYHLAHYDNVTALPNRVKFKEVLEHELINARRRRAIMAVFFLDLDHFKVVNDTLGHAAA